MKLAAGLLVLMLAIGGLSFWAWRSAPDPVPCQEVELATARSPDGRAEAEAFEKRCGESVATHVALRPASAPRRSRADVFVAAGAEQARLSWNERGELVIESPARRVLVEESHWRSVGVRLRRVR